MIEIVFDIIAQFITPLCLGKYTGNQLFNLIELLAQQHEVSRPNNT